MSSENETANVPVKTVSEIVREARIRTGKPARPSDADLVAWFDEQEVGTGADFELLSDASFATISSAPGASLVLVDALRAIWSDARAGKRLQHRRPSAISAATEARPSVPRGRVVEIEVQGFVGMITMCNESKRNAFSAQVCDEMRDGLKKCCSAGVRVVILRARPGVKVWSAGHDIRDFKRMDGSTAQSAGSKFQDPLSTEDSFVQLLGDIKNIAVPVIASIEGSVWGAATDICACCDVLIGTPTVTFAITPAKIGLPYNSSGMAHFIQVMPLHVVKWMFFTCEPIEAEEALRIGFLNRVVPQEELADRTLECANTIASRAPLVVKLLKKQLLSICSTPALTPETFEELHEMRRQTWSSNDMEEGVDAFFQKRLPVFHGD